MSLSMILVCSADSITFLIQNIWFNGVQVYMDMASETESTLNTLVAYLSMEFFPQNSTVHDGCVERIFLICLKCSHFLSIPSNWFSVQKQSGGWLQWKNEWNASDRINMGNCVWQMKREQKSEKYFLRNSIWTWTVECGILRLLSLLFCNWTEKIRKKNYVFFYVYTLHTQQQHQQQFRMMLFSGVIWTCGVTRKENSQKHISHVKRVLFSFSFFNGAEGMPYACIRSDAINIHLKFILHFGLILLWCWPNRFNFNADMRMWFQWERDVILLHNSPPPNVCFFFFIS